MLRFRKFKEKGDVLMNIHDIAKLAGVSVSTVSKVMNGKDKDISEKTKQRVLKVIEEEQYIPYLKFREKEGLKSHLIGLVLKKDNREGDRIIHSAQKAASEKGYGLLVQFAESLEEMQECVNDMQKKKVAGLILDELDHMPVAGEKVTWGNFQFEVVDMDGARIDKVIVKKLEPDSDIGAQSDDGAE